MKNFRFCVVAFLVAIFTCHSWSADETRVYVRPKCVLGANIPRSGTATDQQRVGPLAALGAIFIPVVVEKGLDLVANALRKAGSDKILRDSGKTPLYLYQLYEEQQANPGKQRGLRWHPQLGCVVVVRGAFDPTPEDSASDQQAVAPGTVDTGKDPKDEAARVKRLQASNIPVKTIALEYEAELIPSADRTAFRYESRFFEVSDFQSGGDERAIAVSLVLNGAGVKEDEKTLAVAIMNLGQVKKHDIRGPDELRSQSSSWVGGTGISQESLKAIDSMTIDPKKGAGVMPVTLEATVIETEKGNSMWTFIADVIDATKKDVAKTVTATVTEGEKRKEEALDALEKKRQEEETAYRAYLKAKNDREQLPDNAKQTEKDMKDFEVQATRRLWCASLLSLEKLGATPKGRSEADCKQ